jgi:hypothetical protein
VEGRSGERKMGTVLKAWGNCNVWKWKHKHGCSVDIPMWIRREIEWYKVVDGPYGETNPVLILKLQDGNLIALLPEHCIVGTYECDDANVPSYEKSLRFFRERLYGEPTPREKLLGEPTPKERLLGEPDLMGG